MKVITIEHRGYKTTYTLDETAIKDYNFDLEKYAEAKAKKEIDYKLDVEPKRKAAIKELKYLQNKREKAKQSALDNLFHSVSPSFIALLEKFNLIDIMVEEQPLYNHPLSMVVPQLNALANDMTRHRNLLDRNILLAYWDADKELKEFIRRG